MPPLYGIYPNNLRREKAPPETPPGGGLSKSALPTEGATDGRAPAVGRTGKTARGDFWAIKTKFDEYLSAICIYRTV